MTSALPTVLVGLGRVGVGYAEDPVMAKTIRYAAHAQVLADHPAFEWKAMVDPSEEARDRAAARWPVPFIAASAEVLAQEFSPEVAVLATPPETRLASLEALPTVRAVMVEKPLGRTAAEAEEFLALCAERSIVVQVNLWRRGDEQFRALASGGLRAQLGDPQALFGVYGNGIVNNGTHMVDLVRMLVGEFESVQALPTLVRPIGATTVGAIGGDIDVPFMGELSGGASLTFLPLNFQHYREVGMDIWGTCGRLSILHEGLTLLFHPRAENRWASGEREIASDRPVRQQSTIGDAFYHLYTNLADAVNAGSELWSPGDSALRTERVIDAVRVSVRAGGSPVECRAAAEVNSARGSA